MSITTWTAGAEMNAQKTEQSSAKAYSENCSCNCSLRLWASEGVFFFTELFTVGSTFKVWKMECPLVTINDDAICTCTYLWQELQHWSSTPYVSKEVMKKKKLTAWQVKDNSFSCPLVVKYHPFTQAKSFNMKWMRMSSRLHSKQCHAYDDVMFAGMHMGVLSMLQCLVSALIINEYYVQYLTHWITSPDVGIATSTCKKKAVYCYNLKIKHACGFGICAIETLWNSVTSEWHWDQKLLIG